MFIFGLFGPIHSSERAYWLSNYQVLVIVHPDLKALV